MELIFQFFLLALGLGLLWKVGEITVKEAIAFSTLYGIQRFTIGFFLFAISTGLPEIASVVVASIKEVPELSAGVLLGSTFVNLSFIFPIVLLIAGKMKIESHLKNKLILSTILMGIIFLGLYLSGSSDLFTGILLMALYFISGYWFRTKELKGETQKVVKEIEADIEKQEKKALINPKISVIFKLLASLGVLLLSSWLTVYAAANLSEILGINLSVIGASVVAIGTSLPELALEIHAVKKKEYSLALGDIFGSSLLNVSFILGLLMAMSPDVDYSIIKIILPFFLLLVIWTLYKLWRKKEFRRFDAWIYFVLFGAYTVTLGFWS